MPGQACRLGSGDEAELLGSGDRSVAVVHIERDHRPAQVLLDGGFTEAESGGDRTGGSALTNELQDADLALGEALNGGELGVLRPQG